MPKGGNVIQKGQKIVLKVVVSGTAVELDVNEHQPLKSLMERAFEGASVVGGSDNWYFTDEAGNELDAEKKIAELGLGAVHSSQFVFTFWNLDVTHGSANVERHTMVSDC